MVRSMKWHIWDSENKRYPLCWGEKVLEFDTRESAEAFLNSAKSTQTEYDEDMYDTTIIAEDILYYDGGYLDATGKLVAYDEESESDILIIAL